MMFPTCRVGSTPTIAPQPLVLERPQPGLTEVAVALASIKHFTL